MPGPSTSYTDELAHEASPTFSPPAEYNDLNALRPGTPGTADRNSVADTEKYDYPPSRDVSTPSPSTQGLLYADGGARDGSRDSTYYFDKEAATAKPQAAYQNAGRRGPGYTAALPATAVAAVKNIGASNASRGSFMGFVKRRPLLTALLVLLLLAAIGVGAGVGISEGKSSKSDVKNLSADSNGGKDGNSASGSSSNNGSSSGSSSNTTTETIVPFAKWNWTDPNNKMHGVSLGSWLLLERWQLEDWMVQQAGNDAWDEYRFLKILGPDKGAAALKAHQESWVTEDDMDQLQSAGINTIRIPIGFWAFIPTEDDEPYITTGYIDLLNKMLKWCYERKMYVMLDLHGMPGSQNGDQSSGHNTTNVLWFEENQQARSDAFLQAVLSWASKSPYSSIINSVGVANEPRVVNDGNTVNQTKFELTQNYYERSYAACKKAGFAMTFHHGFYPGSPAQKLAAWSDFVIGKDPNYLVYEDHPYPGWFQAVLPGADAIQASVCEQGQAAVGYPVPVIIGEYSVVSNLNSTQFNKEYARLQLSTYGWSAGSIFWNFKANKSQLQVLAERDEIMHQYSFLDLYADGTISAPGKGQTIKQWLETMGDTCGSFQTFGWTNPATQGAKFSSSNSRRRTLYGRELH